MRRMITNKQVVDIVNKGIEEGEIRAGGLTPEQEEKLDNALTLPEEAPTEQQLVGINTSGEQNALNIGDGLAVVDGELQINGLKFLVIDGNNTSEYSGYEITEDQYTNLQNHTYDFLIIKNTAGGTYIFSYQSCRDQSKPNYYNKKQYMTNAVISCDSKETPYGADQYLAALEKVETVVGTAYKTVYKIKIVGCGGFFKTTSSILIAYNGSLSGNWSSLFGDDPMETLTKGWIIKFRYVDSTDKDDHNAPTYEAIPVFYRYQASWSDESIYAGRVTFYSASGAIFKDFHISFTWSGAHITKWNLTEITQ